MENAGMTADEHAALCAKGEHDRVYSNRLLLSNPPGRRWKCRHCKASGTEFGDLEEDLFGEAEL